MHGMLFLLCATQIIIESLPISSSTHLELLQQWSGVRLPEFFDHFAHGPTILVVAFAFWDAWFVPVRLLLMTLRVWWRRRCSFVALSYSQRRLLMLFGTIVGFVVLADAVTAGCYVVLGRWTKQAHQVSSDGAMLVGLVVTAVLLLSLSTSLKLRRTRVATVFSNLTYPKAIILGLVQGLALLPGISRFASTYVMARWLNLSPRRALQFSWLMLFPLIVAAFAINGLPAVVMHPQGRALLTLPFCVTMIAASVVAYGLLKLVMRMALDGRFWWFGVYLLAPIGYLVLRVMGLV